MTPRRLERLGRARATRQIVDAGQWRAPRAFDPSAPDGLVSFASNDYLGLTQHPRCVAAAHDAIDRWGTGAGAARLIVGSRPVHAELEAELADWKGTEAAVLFPTGFAANLGVLTTFAGPDALVCSDELNHASIIDGRRLAGRAARGLPPPRRRPRRRAAPRATHAPRAIVVTDTVFSMDGDVAPVDELLDVCAHHGALLVLDEAHAVLGPDVRRAPRCPTSTVLRVGTLSKTLGALGGFVAGPRRYTDLLVNRARAYIFTTASSPPTPPPRWPRCGSCARPRATTLRARLRANVDRLRPGHPSPIVPYVCGSEARALDGGRRARRARACSSPPSARRRCRRARRACGSRCRPPTPPTRSTRSPTALAELFPTP